MPKVARGDAKGKKGRKGDGGPTRARRAAGWVFTPGRLLLAGLGVLAAAAAPWLVGKLPDVAGRPEYRLRADRVTLTPPPPAGVPPSLAADVLGPDPASVLEDGLADRLAAGFAAHPWVAGVERVELTGPGGRAGGASAAVTLRYRRPVAAVVVGEGLYPVAADGTLLPPADFTRRTAEALPRIAGVASRPGPAGTAWPDPRVAGAAAVCEVLAADWAAAGLAAVRPVPRPGGGASRDAVWLELETRTGSRVVWGEPPGGGDPLTLPAAEKRRRLLTEARSLLDGRPGSRVWVDLSAWDGIYHRPLPPAVAGRGGSSL